ncbi:Imm63 family immunity protein [Actinoplanes sp. NPDC023714]|uniref:Imm63 family immunity protein n=1 Tax=Actinoplanes sp. NPDC023714 TaxID=3154322 RepID=UPI00340EEC33
MFKRDAGPSALEREIRRLGALIGARETDLVSFEHRDGGYPCVAADPDGTYRWWVTERGRELESRETRDLGEILYWAMAYTTWMMGGDWALRHPVAGEEQRVTRWRRQFALLAELDPAWPERCRAELIAKLPPGSLPEGGVPPAGGGRS